jgi:DNA mismatch repair protein MutS2
VNAHALQVLEFEAAVRAVASRCASELGRAALLDCRPGTDVASLRTELAAVAQTLDLHQAHPSWAPPAPPDARRPLKVLEVEGGVLAADDLLIVLRLLEASGTLSEGLAARLDDEAAPHLPALRRALLRDSAEVQRLSGVVDDDGNIRDGASPLLRQLRKRIRSARTRIVRRLEAFVASLPERIRVPDASVSLRDGRYVIQLRREGKSDVGGVIHGESATGATLFVEPPLALELTNEIQELELEEGREIQRILRDTSARLRPLRDALSLSLDALVRFDTLWARGLAAARWDAHLPELLSPEEEGRSVRYVNGRHPLLLEKALADPDHPPIVPFSLDLDPGERALVISGPNTGGKTVFLKAVGLLPLLAQSGILPPVGPGSRLPVLRDVFADIGDEQSIAESLSTFSAHLANAREILEGAGPGTLVLMDEMGTGTDPAEGAALARAILETLVFRGARAVVTSHLGAMKRLDGEGTGIVNASLLFDAERIEPTYRFRKGEPGRSYGLAIARRLGFPPDVLDRAEGYVDSGELEIETLLASLEAKERALIESVDEATRARREAEALREEGRRRAAELAERERTAESRAREDARRFLLEARDEVEQTIRELREADRGQIEAREAREREARRRLEAAARVQGERAERVRRGRRGREAGGSTVRGPGASGTGPTAPGDRVRILGSGAKGVVREVEADRVTVEVGALRFEVDHAEVERIAGPETPKERAARGGGGQIGVPDVEARTEVHLLGLRVDDVEHALGRALDDAVLGHLGELRIVHGKGTGAVKARVLELLRQDRRVETFRGGVHGEGGAGVTVAVLR